VDTSEEAHTLVRFSSGIEQTTGESMEKPGTLHARRVDAKARDDLKMPA
jgi:hypothetical protein